MAFHVWYSVDKAATPEHAYLYDLDCACVRRGLVPETLLSAIFILSGGSIETAPLLPVRAITKFRKTMKPDESLSNS